MNHEEAKDMIRSHFEDGSLDRATWQKLSDHIRECDSCKAEYDGYAKVEAALAGGAAVSPARLERVRDLGPPAPQEEKRNVVPLFKRAAAPLLAIAAAMILWVTIPDEGLRPRGSGTAGKGAWVTPFFTASDGKSQRLEKKLPAKAKLLFSYTVLKEAPYRYLAIAGLDAAGRAHWYYPAYTEASERPQSIAVQPGRADYALPDEVFANHAAGPLKICAMFTEAPISVKAADAELERKGQWPKAHLDCHDVEVAGE